jgi:hypothetical protein
MLAGFVAVCAVFLAVTVNRLDNVMAKGIVTGLTAVVVASSVYIVSLLVYWLSYVVFLNSHVMLCISDRVALNQCSRDNVYIVSSAEGRNLCLYKWRVALNKCRRMLGSRP